MNRKTVTVVLTVIMLGVIALGGLGASAFTGTVTEQINFCLFRSI